MRGKIKISIILISIIMMALIPNSYGALTSKPTTKTDGSNVLVNKTVSASYLLCQQMKSNGESLYGTSVKPHLATNKDWGAVSYLSNSVYGTNTTGQNTGIEKTINGVRYYSTTGNASGVMNWGSNPYKAFITHTAGLTTKCSTDESLLGNYRSLYDNRNTEFVDFFDTSNNSDMIGMAIGTLFVDDLQVGHSPDKYPISVRKGFFNGRFGSSYNMWGSAQGRAGTTTTFRPVVWN